MMNGNTSRGEATPFLLANYHIVGLAVTGSESASVVSGRRSRTLILLPLSHQHSTVLPSA